jgi:DNA invertase Pin-like site-specific DNA recombinase
MNGKRPLAYSYIRMSTDLQLKGDSRRRQLEKSTAYASEHKLQLADDAQLEDIGISAFRGANVRDGALGGFLEAVKKGQVERGSFLLVESLDRISRQEVRKSLSLFLGIIDAGINIVTLGDNRVYTADGTDEVDLVTSLVIMARAHEESRTKSQRISAAWANKRSQARTRPLTRWCPAWLRLSDDRTHYEIIPERAAIVRSIFEDTVSGMGNYTITRRLNSRKVPHFGRSSNGWHNSYVNKILKNRATIGELQPHRVLPNQKRAPIGDPIKGYFPPIINEDLFYRAQLARAERRVVGRGRKGAYVSNLFSGLATCVYCRSRMKFENKGPSPKGGSYLVCVNALRGLGCIETRWRYDHFEASFLAFVEQLNLDTLLRTDVAKKKELDDAIAALAGEQIVLSAKMEKTYELLAKAEAATDFVAQKLNELQKRRSDIEAIIKEKQSERFGMDSTETAFYESKDEIKSLVAKLQKSKGEEIYKLRSAIAARVKSIISVIFVAPVGSAPATKKAIDFLSTQPSAEAGDVIQYLQAQLEDPKAHQRYFAIGFKDGSTLGVYPKDNDPVQFERKVIADPGKDSGPRVITSVT